MRSSRVLVWIGLALAVCMGSTATAFTDQVHETPAAMSVDIAPAPFVPLAVDAIVADLQTELAAPFADFKLTALAVPSTAAAAPPPVDWRSCTATAPRPHADLTALKPRRMIAVQIKPKPSHRLELST